MNKILIGIPTNSIKDYCWNGFVSALKTIITPNVDVLFIDNTKGHHYRHKITKAGYKCLHVNPSGKELFEVLSATHNLLREETLKCGYTHLLHLESDIIVKTDTLTKLLSHNIDVCGFPYFIENGSKLMLQRAEERQTSNLCIIFNPGYDIMWLTGKVEQFFAIGLGCVLIKREVLEQVKFRSIKGVNSAPDTIFYNDLYLRQIPVYCDTSEVLTHLQKNKWKTV